jgi:hypothetical protein
LGTVVAATIIIYRLLNHFRAQLIAKRNSKHECEWKTTRQNICGFQLDKKKSLYVHASVRISVVDDTPKDRYISSIPYTHIAQSCDCTNPMHNPARQLDIGEININRRHGEFHLQTYAVSTPTDASAMIRARSTSLYLILRPARRAYNLRQYTQASCR